MDQDTTTPVISESPKSIPRTMPDTKPPKVSATDGDFSEEKPVTFPTPANSGRFWNKPRLKQYWHDGVLYTSQSSYEVDTSILFVDLLYVGIIAVNADTTVENLTKTAFLRFCVTFLPTWKIWSDIAILVSQFEADELSQRTIILFILACLVGFTTNIYSAFYTTYAQLVAFYLAARFCVALVTLALALFIPRVRPIMLFNLVSILVPAVFWIGSCFLDENLREILIWLAISFDMWGSLIIVWLIRDVPKLSTTIAGRVKQTFQYFPAIEVRHRSERVGAFVSLVFGYSVVGILYQSQSKFGINAFYGKAVLGLVQAFCFNWLYFDVDQKYQQAKSTQRHTISAALWFNAHLPFIMAFTLSAAALSRLVVAHDCINADPEHLTPMYEERSEAELTDGLRWFYCSGLGISFLCMGVISLARGDPPRRNERIPQKLRLVLRAAVAVVWICLPLAKELNSLELIGITASTTVFALAVDVYGMGQEDLPREDTDQFEPRPVTRRETVIGF
ncbi:hypothetical protein FRC01_004133 [Tulasnella sp. 417]|nr:hypothetical protein FRC01_004133 [Tulasnella sp. 417]